MKGGLVFLIIVLLIAIVVVAYFLTINYLDKGIIGSNEAIVKSSQDNNESLEFNQDNGSFNSNYGFSGGTPNQRIENSNPSGASESFIDDGTCIDSDNGINPDVKGKVTKLSDETLYYHDLCVVRLENDMLGYYVKSNGIPYGAVNSCSNGDCFIAEAYCYRNSPQFQVENCQNGCNNGKCL